MAFTKKIAGWVAGRIKGEEARKDTMRWMEKTGLGMLLDAAGDYVLTQGALKGAGKLKGLITGGGQATPAAARALPEGVQEVGRLASAGPEESRAMVAQMMSGPAPSPMQAMTSPGLGAVKPSFQAPGLPTALPSTPAPLAGAPAGQPAFSPSAGAARVPRPVAPSLQAPAIPGAPAPRPGLGPTFTPTPRPSIPPAAPTAAAPMAAPPVAPPPSPMGKMVTGTTQKVAEDGKPGLFSRAAQFGRENAAWIGPTATATANVLGQRAETGLEEERMKREQEAKNRLAMLLMPMFQSQLGQFGQSLSPRG